jgi:hypothetical protein
MVGVYVGWVVGKEKNDPVIVGELDLRFIADTVCEKIIELCKQIGITQYAVTKMAYPYHAEFSEYLLRRGQYHGYQIDMSEADYTKLMSLIGKHNYVRGMVQIKGVSDE